MKSFLFFLTLTWVLFGCVIADDDTGSDLPDQFRDFATVFDGNGIGGIIALNFNRQILINTSGDRYAWFEDDEVKKEWSITDPAGPFRNFPANSIGTGMILEWVNADHVLYVTEADGKHYYRCEIVGDVDDFSNWTNPDFYFDNFSAPRNTKDQWGTDGTFPFDAIGAGIKSNWFACLGGLKVEIEQFLLVNAAGDQVSNYIVQDLESRSPFNVSGMHNFVGAGCPPDGYRTPFSKIGAATLYESNDGALNVIYFSKDGKSFAYIDEVREELSKTYSF